MSRISAEALNNYALPTIELKALPYRYYIGLVKFSVSIL